ncbi:MAG: DEAD/DEAH box helicase [Actinobacteria bacterium]|nr:DEAD/DEAH box helicase [Actinomycetota bacterium]NDA45002.1 DEAD/DEAH box helicase [Actinomycetota bacterium]NDE39031.1 DEAD/DEAH box helicase [Actinomycetota bacterium]NDE65307.1 DEAD/DEAH box helicase [Actinomycetota bacterium]
MTTPAEKFAAAKVRNQYKETTAFVQSFDFEFDPFQVAACHAVEEGSGVLVAAPTGAGKTVVGEFAAHLALKLGKKCFYTTPIKALSNQKYSEFVAMFGEDRVGLLTGDTSINGEADVLVMTTEVLRNMLYAGSNTLINLGYVVMDEVHYLADKFRGAVWEEVLIHLMESVQVISLSATVSNAEEFGEWLGEVRGNTQVIVSEIRPIPLYQHVLIGNRLLDLFDKPGQINPEILRREREAVRKASISRHRRGRFSEAQDRLSRADIIEKLANQNLLPAITFIFSRIGCDAAVKQCLHAGLRLTSTAEREEIRSTALKYTQNIAEEDLVVLGFDEWLSALERGIAAHHAGLLPSFKSAVEELFQKGLIKAVFATETLALGINMPARTVVLEKLIKYNGESHVPITPGEYTQLTGRAGRRGIDIEGNAVIQWSPTVDSASAAGLASTRTYPLRSSFAPTYNMSINLIARFGRERARRSLESSFAQFQADRAVVGLSRQIAKNEAAIEELLSQAVCHLGDFLEYARIRREIKEVESLLSRRDHKKTFDNKQRARLEADLTDLRKGLRNHSCHSCAQREDHSRFAEKAGRLNRENDGLRTRVQSRTHVIAKTFDQICQVLTHLGYIEGEKPTAQGKILTKIYAESDLLLTEAIRRGVLDELNAPELLSVVSTMIFESRNADNVAPKMPSPRVSSALADVISIWAELEELETEYGVKTQRQPDAGFCWVSYRWANGNSLQSVLKGTDMSVGDFVRSTKQLSDLLNQIAGASEKLRPVCKDAVKRIDRGVVAFLMGDL